MSQAAVYALQLADIEAWCDAHPFDFDRLVETKATPDAVHNWHEAHVSPTIHSDHHPPAKAASMAAGACKHGRVRRVRPF